jgi:prepilin-type N-terminal cleavage/methylation domain-containing protein
MFTKKIKRAFTLVELSIVLLVLAILVGALLVGREIVDRTKVIKVSQEIDTYKKAVNMFYDTYGVHVGNVDKATCQKYPEFRKAKDSAGVSICVSTVAAGSSPFVTEGCTNYAYPSAKDVGSSYMSPLMLKLAGLIENVRGTTSMLTIAYGAVSYWITSNYYIYSVIDGKNAIAPLGVNFSNSSTFVRGPAMRGYLGPSGDITFIEFNGPQAMNQSYTSSGFQRIIYQNPYLFYHYSIPSGAANCVEGNDAIQSSCNPRGGLTAHVSRMIDEKYDDGKPYEGLILAVKPGLVNKEYSDVGGVYKPKDVADTANYCTSMQFIRGTTTALTDNGTGTKYNDYQLATYTTNTTYSKNIQYGCNMVFGIEK